MKSAEKNENLDKALRENLKKRKLLKPKTSDNGLKLKLRDQTINAKTGPKLKKPSGD